jgi:hypothetical protein
MFRISCPSSLHYGCDEPETLRYENLKSVPQALTSDSVQFMGPEARVRQFETLRPAVRPGGRLVLHGYTPEQVDYGTGGPPSRENMYTIELLNDAFNDWRILRLAAYEREVQEGRGHSGQSALIDMVAQKPNA